MKVEINEIGELQRNLSFCLPADAVESAMQEKFKMLLRSARLDGFRPGKIPQKLLVSRYSESARSDVIHDLISRNLTEISKKMRARLAGPFVIKEVRELQGEGIQVTCTVEIMPEFELAAMGDCVIFKYLVPCSEKNLVQFIRQHVSEGLSGKEESDGPAAENDFAIVRFKNAESAACFSKEGKQTQLVNLASLHSNDPLFHVLRGAAKGKQCVVDYVFQENFPHEKLAGTIQSVEFVVESIWRDVQDGLSKQALIEEVRQEYEAHEYEQKMRQIMERWIADQVNRSLSLQADALLLEQHDFPVPASLVSYQERFLVQAMQKWEPVRLLRMFAIHGSDTVKKIASSQVRMNELRRQIVADCNFKFNEDNFYQSLAGIPGYENAREKPPSGGTVENLKRMAQADEEQKVVLEWVCRQVEVREMQASYAEFFTRLEELQRADTVCVS